MKIFIAICTFVVGVTIEYFVLLQSLHKGNSFFDYLFLFTIIVMPSLFLFGIPISLIADYVTKGRNQRILKAVIIHGVGGVSAAIIILLIALPGDVLTDMFHKQYVFFILNGTWFSFLFLLLDELQKKIEVRLRRGSKDIITHSS